MRNTHVNTWTSMSVSTDQGTMVITSKVTESVASALAHLEAMGKGRPEPVYTCTSAGWRWSWEFVSMGVRCVDTVRIY